MNTELLAKEIARVVIEHGYLHLGECTLLEFIGKELNVNEKTLKQAGQDLNTVLGEMK